MSIDQYSATITVVSADFGSPASDHNPFVAFEHNNLKYKTGAVKKPGQHALWNEKFELPSLRKPNELFL